MDSSETFAQLVQNRFLTRVTERDGLALADREMAEEAEAVNLNKGFNLTAKEKKKLQEEQAAKRAREYDDSVSTGQVCISIKDLRNVQRAHESLETTSAKLAETRLNNAAGEVMRQLLRCTELKTRDFKEQVKTEPVTTMMVQRELPADIDLAIEGPSSGNKLLEYMETLADGSEGLLQKTGEGGGGSYCCPIRDVVSKLKQRIIENIIVERFGDTHKRIWRLLLMKEKLDEKQVTKMAMVPTKEARRCLFDLHNAGFIFIQDVPRTTDHSPAKTFFLFYVSIPLTVNHLIQSLYPNRYPEWGGTLVGAGNAPTGGIDRGDQAA
ncbi:DNA-directed RNA polymerase III subunit RPC3 [Rhizophlyctis rosea]|nr:DNA-directed RNA polymerase III subunit RPC3 [Rhizophlyctis rosea]